MPAGTSARICPTRRENAVVIGSQHAKSAVFQFIFVSANTSFRTTSQGLSPTCSNISNGCGTLAPGYVRKKGTYPRYTATDLLR